MNVPLIDLHSQFRSIESEIRTAINEVLLSQKFILDSQVQSLEQEMAAYTESRFAIACASGTDAILLALAGLGVGVGDEVITTAYSFFATAGMVRWLNAKPVFVDIDPATFNIQVEAVTDKVTSRTKALIPVDLFGQCARIEELKQLGIPVIEDAAQAIGSSRQGKAAGSLGDIASFSFFPTKNLGGYGDGGMMTTSNEELAIRLRSLRSHGQSSRRYFHETVGTNSRLDELQAAILRVKLRHLDRWNMKRTENARLYREGFADLPLELPVIDENNHSNYHQFVIKTEKRDSLKDFLAAQGVGTAIYYPVPLPHQPCFSDLGYRPGDFPGAEQCAAMSLALPIHSELSGPQIEYVIDRVRSFYHP